MPFHWGGDQSANRLTNDALDPISRMPEFKVCAVRVDPRRGAPHDVPSGGWSSSATAWPAPGWSRRCSRAAAASASTSRCSATSRTATTTASCSRACSPRSHKPDDIFINPLPWYAGQRRHAARRRARRADRSSRAKQVIGAPTASSEPYDTLVIATGSSAARFRRCDGTCGTEHGNAQGGRVRLPHARRLRAHHAARRNRAARGRHRRRAARPRGRPRPAEPRASRCTSCT